MPTETSYGINIIRNNTHTTILRLNNNYQRIHSTEFETTTPVIRLIK